MSILGWPNTGSDGSYEEALLKAHEDAEYEDFQKNYRHLSNYCVKCGRKVKPIFHEDFRKNTWWIHGRFTFHSPVLAIDFTP